MKKPIKTGSGHAAPGEYSDAEFKAQFPTLFEFIGCTKYDDGSPRKTATLLCFVEAGLLKVCLNDRDVLRQAFISARTFTEALSMLDDQLSQDSVEWRPVKAAKRV